VERIMTWMTEKLPRERQPVQHHNHNHSLAYFASSVKADKAAPSAPSTSAHSHATTASTGASAPAASGGSALRGEGYASLTRSGTFESGFMRPTLSASPSASCSHPILGAASSMGSATGRPSPASSTPPSTPSDRSLAYTKGVDISQAVFKVMQERQERQERDATSSSERSGIVECEREDSDAHGSATAAASAAVSAPPSTAAATSQPAAPPEGSAQRFLQEQAERIRAVLATNDTDVVGESAKAGHDHHHHPHHHHHHQQQQQQRRKEHQEMKEHHELEWWAVTELPQLGASPSSESTAPLTSQGLLGVAEDATRKVHSTLPCSLSWLV